MGLKKKQQNTNFFFLLVKISQTRLAGNVQRSKLKKNTKIGFVRRNTMKILLSWRLVQRCNDINVKNYKLTISGGEEEASSGKRIVTI